MSTKKPQPAYLTNPQAFDMTAADEIFARASTPVVKQEQAKGTNPLLRAAQDTGLSLLSGAMSVPEFAVGLANIPTGGWVGQRLERMGFRPAEARKIIEDLYTPEQREANKKVQEADGFFGVAGEAIRNPSVIYHEGVKAVPAMLGGQLIGRALLGMAPKMSGAVASALGEGTVMTGQQAEQIRQQTEDGLLTAKQSGLALATGTLGGLTSALGNKLAGRWGLVDPDQVGVRMGVKAGAAIADESKPPMGLARRTLGGALAEGVVEEAPQSAIEQAAQNLALDRPVEEGVGGAVALGMLTGGAMGGGVAALSPGNQLREMKLPEVGPTTRALNAGVESAATKADAAAPVVAPNAVAAPATQLTGPQILARAEQRVRDAGLAQASTTTPTVGVDRGQQIMAEALRRTEAIRAAGANQSGGAAPTDWATSPGAASTREAPPGSIEFTQELPPDTSGMTLADGPMPRKPRGTPSQELQDAVWAARNLTLQPTDAEIEARTARVGGKPAEVLTPLSPANTPLLGMSDRRAPQPQIGIDRSVTGRMRAGEQGIQPEERWQQISDEQRAADEQQRRTTLGRQAPQASPRQESPGTPGLSRVAEGLRADAGNQPDTSKIYKSLSIATRQARLAGPNYKTAPAPDGAGYTIQAIKAATLGGNPLARPVLPAVETKGAEAVRKAAGDVVLRLPAPALLEVAKSADGKLDAGRIANIDAVVTSGRQLSGIPSVGLGADGGVAVDDGRHRILYAATRGMDLDVRVPAQDAEAVKALVYAAPAAPQEGVAKPEAVTSQGAVVEAPAPTPAAAPATPSKAVYRNPTTGDTWSGRGLKPKWVMEALASGVSLDDLRVDAGATAAPTEKPIAAPQQAEKPNTPIPAPDTSAVDWAGLGKADREAVISKAGWAAPGGGLKPQARDWVGRQWKDIGLKARAKLSPALREHVETKAAAPKAQAEETKAPRGTETPAPVVRPGDSSGEQSAAPAEVNVPRYSLPELSVFDEWAGSKSVGYIPTDRQKTLLDAVARAKEGGKFALPDIVSAVASDIKVSEQDMKRGETRFSYGDFYNDVGRAVDYFDHRSSKDKDQKTIADFNLKIGKTIGVVKFADGSKVVGAVVESIDGGKVSIVGRVGRQQKRISADAWVIGAAINRAERDGLRATNIDGRNQEEVAATPTKADDAVEQQKQQDELGRMQSEKQAQQEAAQRAKNDAWRENTNTVFTDDAAERAREIIRSRLKVANNKQRGGIDPELMAAGITLAGWHIEKGARKFAAYAKAMIEDMGEEVRPYLKSWYMGVKYDPRAAGFDGMDSAATVDAASVEDTKPVSDAEIIAAYRKITQNPRNPMSMTEIGRLHREVGGSLSALHDSLKRMADNGRVYFVVGEPTAITQQERDAGIDVGGKRYYNVEITDQGPGKDEQTNERRGIQEQSPQALGRVAATEGVRAEGSGPTGASTPSSSQQRAEPGERADDPGVSPARSAGGGVERVRSTAAGARGERDAAGARGRNGAREGAPTEPASLTQKSAPSNIPAANFQITEDVRLGQGGEAEKFRDNLGAIRIVKTLEREQRRATPDEQRTLARYVGWGGLANAFADDTGAFKAGWEKRGAELADLLTPDELAAARRTTRNAHYTSETIVRGMWDAVRRLGFNGGMVFESSMGTGNFLGLVPQDIGGKTHFVGVEYDSLTSRIAQALYPQATVLHSGLQKVPLPDGEFDLNIGNPPFGSESLRFQFKPELNGLSIHNQFFLAGLDALKPGGVQALVVSRYLLDAKDSTARKRIFTKAKLLGAIRLPDTAFKENARTDVVTDILFLQRRTPESEAAAREMVELNERRGTLPQKEIQRFRELTAAFKDETGWVGTTNIPDPLGGEAMTVNSYFMANPGMVLGRMERSGSMRYEGDIAVKLPAGADLGTMLADAVRKLPENVMPTSASPAETVAQRHKTMSEALGAALDGLEPGAMLLADGRLQQVVERETPTGDYELSRRDITPNSPWSPSLMLDSAGRWYRLVVETDEKGDAVKNGRANVYKRETFATENDVPESLRLGKAAHERLVGMVGLRDILKRQLTLESKDAPARELEANRNTLKAAYDGFVSRHGFVNERSNAALVGEMPDGALVLALETSYRPEVTAVQAKKSGEAARRAAADPAPILLRRVVEPYTPPGTASSPADALAITMAEGGKVDAGRIAGLLGVSEDEAIKQLTTGDKPLVFKDPETQTWETRDAYLSGQVKRKLAAARAAGMSDNVRALEEVQPEPWGADAVTAILGSTWVPREVYADFAEHLTGGKALVTFSPVTNSFGITISNPTSKAQDWASEGVKVDWLLHKVMNSEQVRVTYVDQDGKTHVDTERTALAQLKAKQLQTEFADWVFADGDRRRKLVEVFNEKFNTRVSRQFDGSHLILPGKVPDAVIGMRRHQKNAIWRGISQRFMLLDHVVGAGKTFTAIARAMERRRMGLSRKPTVVVPNHMVEQFTADIYRLYPGAKVLAAGKKDFEKSRRRRLFAKIATGDWDIVVIPHSSFGYIGISPETEERYLTQELTLARQAIKDAEEEASAMGLGGRAKPFNVKEAERLAEKIEGRMDALKKATRDTLLTFEQLGIDDLTVDEAHEFKNLFYSSRLSGVRGLNDKTGSQKAFDLYNKVRVLRESGGSVTFMTGTPISNSAVEMYTMMRYLAADDLRELGLEHFDAWRAQFVDVSTKFEPTESGRLKEVNRLGRNWSNMRSLMDLYYSFTDAVTIDDIKKWYAEDNNGAQFPVPRVKGGGRQSVVVKPTTAQMRLLGDVLAGFDSLDDIKDPVKRNAERLRLMDRARKVSLDVRAIDPLASSKEIGGKLDTVADNVARIYKKWDARKGTQLVFLDRSVPKAKGDDARIKEFDKLMAERAAALAKGDEPTYRRINEKLEKIDTNEISELRAAAAGGWNAYQQIKDNLVARGIPAGQVRFVQEANTDAQKQALFDAVNSGEVRVLLGSTPRMGAGTNVQKRMVALHHVDVTWKPSDIEQREGRLIRQGNDLLQQLGDAFEVEILAYATERTADAKMWDLNSTKLKTINGIRKYDGQFTMEFEDSDAVGMAELAALASGDPKLLERVTLDSEISRLELEERAFSRRRHGLRDQIDRAERDLRDLPGEIQKSTERAAEMTKRLDAMLAETAGRSVEVEGAAYTSHFDAERAAMQAIDTQQAGDKAAKFAVKVGSSRRTSEAGIRAAIDEALGDVAPFSMRVGSEELKQRTEAARRLADSAGKLISTLESSRIDPPTARVGEFLGLRLEMDVSRGKFGNGFEVSLTLVDPATGRDKALAVTQSETAIVSTQAMRGVIDRLLADARMAASYTSRFDERKLEQARAELPSLKERDAQPFPKAQELAGKRERLEALVQELAGKGASTQNQQAAATSAGKEPPASRDAYMPPASSPKPSLRQIEAFAKSASSKWTNGPSGGVRVVKNASELDDDALRTWVDAADPDGVAKGFYHPGSGTVYLLADRIDSIAQAQFVLFHEVYGHHGLRSVLGGEYASTMTSLGRANPELSRLAQQWMRNYGTQEVDARVQFGADRAQAERDVRLLATEEALSDWATQTPEIGRLKFLVARVQRGLRAIGLGVVADWLEGNTGAEVLDLLVRARRSVAGGKEAAGMQERGGMPTFSRAGMLDNISRKGLQNILEDATGSAGAKLNWLHKSIGTQWHKAQTFPEFRPVFDAVQGFYTGTSRLANEAADQAPHILPKLERVRDLFRDGLPGLLRNGIPTADARAVSKPVFEGTLVWRRDADGQLIRMSEGESVSDAGVVFTDDELRNQFKLTNKQIDYYREFRDAVDTSLDQAVAADVVRYLGASATPEMRAMVEGDRRGLRGAVLEALTQTISSLSSELNAIQDEITSLEDSGEGDGLGVRITELQSKRQKLQAKLQAAIEDRDRITEKYTRIDELKAKGYAPLMRFGKFAVNVAGPDGKSLFFSLYETRMEANRAAREMREQFADTPGAEVTQGVLSRQHHELFAGVPFEALEMFAGELGRKDDPAFQAWLKLAKNNRSALKRLIHRKGTAGFSEDAPRVLASFITSNARMASGAMHLDGADKMANEIEDGDVQDEAINLLKAVKNPAEVAILGRGLLFANFIGGSIASAVVNLTQPITMTLPYLSQWGGGAVASKRLASAGAAVASGRTPEHLKDALKRAEDEGVVSPQEIHHLMAQASGSWRIPGGGAAQAALQKLALLWGGPFSLAEQFNRRVTFLAAYETAVAEGLGDPFTFAERTVLETQGLYNKGNSANWARNPVGALALTFKQFSVHYLEWLVRMAKSGPQGRRAALMALALLAAAGGADGLPFADDVDDLIDTIAQAMGLDFSAKRKKREFIADQLGLGDEWANVVLHGFSAIPGVPMDVSLRMGMGNLIPATGMLLRSNTDRSRDVFEVAGAAGGLAKQYIGATEKALAGDFAGAGVAVLPVALQNALRGLQMYSSGEYRDTKDRRVSDVGTLDAIMKGIGFQPQGIAMESQKLGEVRRSIDLARQVESEIVGRLARAYIDKDQGALTKARQDLADWNSTNPGARIAITPAQIARRAREMRATREERFVRAAPKEMRQEVLERMK